MQNIKNFKITPPTAVQRETVPEGICDTIHWLTSEDGQCWYACQKLFANDTIKIMYNEDSVIVSVVDKPVPQRGNTLAVSMFFPVNMSVAEIAAEDYPDGVSIDGTWKFDGARICQDSEIVEARILRKNTARRNSLVMEATNFISMIQCSSAVKDPRPNDAILLIEFREYIDELRDVDLTLAEPDWPPKPEIIN